MLRPVGKNILVKVKPVEKKLGGLILPESNDAPFVAVVLGVGAKVELEVEKGHEVLLVPYSGSKFNEDPSYLIVTERDIIGIVGE